MIINSNYYSGEIAFLKISEDTAVFSYRGKKLFPKNYKLEIEGQAWVVVHTLPSDYVPSVNNVYLKGESL